MPVASDEQQLEEKPAAVKRPRTRRGKAVEEQQQLPAELAGNEKLQAAAPAWRKLYAAIHNEVRK